MYNRRNIHTDCGVGYQKEGYQRGSYKMVGNTVYLIEGYQRGDTIHIDTRLYCRFSKEGYQ
jgi:hypothetical protein